MPQLTPYNTYLKRLYEKWNASWRKQQRKNFRPCETCTDDPAEIVIVFTSTGIKDISLCRPCKATWSATQPFLPHAKRLDLAGVKYLSEEDWRKGLKAPKIKRRKMEVVIVDDIKRHKVTKTRLAKIAPGKAVPAKAPAAPRKPAGPRLGPVLGSVLGSVKRT